MSEYLKAPSIKIQTTVSHTEFKDSSLGPIPNDWEIVKLEDIGKFSTSSVDKKSSIDEQPVYLLNYMDIYNNSFLTERYRFQRVTASQEHITSSSVQHGDVFFTPSSETPSDIGHSAVFIGNLKNLVHSYHTVRFRPFTTQYLADEFKAYAFKSDQILSYFRIRATGSTRFTLSLPTFNELELPTPPLHEQKKIAAILTSVDEVIENTQKQIDKLQDLKKATMNELLTKGIGHTEFKDSEIGLVPYDWKILNLEDIGKFSTSSVNKKSSIDEQPVYLLNYMDIYNNSFLTEGYRFQSVTASQEHITSSSVQHGDVFFTPSSETPDDIGHSAVFLGNVNNLVHSYHTVRFRPFSNLYLTDEFKAYVFKSDRINKYFRKRATGSTRFTLSLPTFKELRILTPPLHEQKKITAILTSMDNLIENTQKQYYKLQDFKKALMQDLLTGKVRVITLKG